MTRFNPPLTPAETTALQQACAEMDGARVEQVYAFNAMRYESHGNYAMTRDAFWLELETAYHLAAAVLAGQMAARL